VEGLKVPYIFMQECPRFQTVYSKMDSICRSGIGELCLQLKPDLSPDFIHEMHGNGSNTNPSVDVRLTLAGSGLN